MRHKFTEDMKPYIFVLCAVLATTHAYNVGVGIADVTGPPAEVNFMGYANLQQKGQGLHLRQFSRAFMVEQDGTRVVYVSVDAAMMGHGVKKEVMKNLKKRYGTIYNISNVLISGTHTHSTPGGFLMDFLFDITIFGFVQETFSALVNGITKSIIKAHESAVPARLFYAETQVLEANINRSPTSYLNNPAQERAAFEHDVDKTLAQLQMISQADGTVLGVLNWFAVHPTSMNNTNRLVSSDNVGYASIRLEKALNPPGTFPGKGTVVAGFASTNLGDVSPNTRGPRCERSGRRCDLYSSRCADHDPCFASGPGKDMFESTKIIATTISDAALKLLQSRGEEITGPISAVHQFVDMPSQKVPLYDPLQGHFDETKKGKGCLPALGYSFAAGTTDGPGAFNFSQGTTSGNPLWNAVRDFIAEPTKEDIECHAPKPILLATGRVTFPYEWHPRVVGVQILSVGQLVLASAPGELTTMAGRRARKLIASVFANKRNNTIVVMAGLSNAYTHYITTFEEYQAQRYEAASTIYGPHTLNILLYKYLKLATAIAEGTKPPRGPEPADLSNGLVSLVPPVIFDAAPLRWEFGDVTKQPRSRVSRGDTVVAHFIAGHPRNNLQHGAWYAAVERLEDAATDSWTVVLTDADWDTKYIWERSSTIMGTSRVEVRWDIAADTPPGIYRLRHHGHYKYILGGIYPYQGFTDNFTVV